MLRVDSIKELDSPFTFYLLQGEDVRGLELGQESEKEQEAWGGADRPTANGPSVIAAGFSVSSWDWTLSLLRCALHVEITQGHPCMKEEGMYYMKPLF